MEYIFHEKQDGSLCAQHCLNSLLQGDYYSAIELAQIAEQLDTQERLHMSEAGVLTKDYERFLNEGSSNYDDSGFFSIQVLQKALESWNIDLIPYTSQNRLAVCARENPIEQKAFICNFKQHWYTIRKIANYWFDLNSLYKHPRLISDTYLSILLAQLEKDGYSIFVISGDLPKTLADSKLIESPLNVKQILANYDKIPRQNIDEDGSDDELKQAIKMSLIENDIDLDNDRLANFNSKIIKDESGIDEEDELKRAIELSLKADQQQNEKPITSSSLSSSESNNTTTTNTTINNNNNNNNNLSADDIRKKDSNILII